MPYGYFGKILNVDLTKREYVVEELPEIVYRKVLGGEGLGAWLLNERVPVGADSLGKDNLLIIAPGLLAGSNAPASPRVMTVTKSPLTGGFGDSNAGGAYGPELRKCGFDALCISGISDKLVYISILDGEISINDASHLEGMDTVETKEALIDELKVPKLKVASIGVAGEKNSLISAIMFDDRAAARSGVGAVMGSKNLKSIAIKGSERNAVCSKEEIVAINRKFGRHILDVDYFVLDIMRKYGSCGFMSLGVKVGINPIKNWSLAGEESFPKHHLFDAENVTKYKIKNHGCLGCPVQCGGTIKVEDGPFKLDEARLPEYETLNAFGPFIMCEDVEASFKAQELCDKAGIDTISVGHVVALAIECFENDIIDENDTFGLQLKWGNSEDIIKLVDDICKRERFGSVLADGVKTAIERIGKGSEKYGVHIGGQAPAFHDFRYEAPARGVTYISDPTPARHERCSGGQIMQLNKALGMDKEFIPEKVSLDDDEGMGKLFAKGARYYTAFSACGFCAYILGAVEDLDMIGLIKAFTGWEDYTAQDFMDSGERIQTLRQMFSIREGLTPDKVKFPPRLEEKPMFEGPMRGTDREFDWYGLREEYFKGFNWDGKTGRPLKERMEELGIEQFYIGD
jgi:aldehyde:ferredoxin oxidoreductase